MFSKIILAVIVIVNSVQLLGTDQEVTLGVAWQGEASMALRVTNAMNEVLMREAPQIKIEWHKALKTKEDLDRVAKQFQNEKDGMLLVRSSGAKYLRDNPPVIPSFIGGCNHPGQLGVIKNLAAPEGKVTGVTYALDYAKSFKVFQTILPTMKSVCLIYEIGHPGSIIDRNGTKEMCRELSLAYSETGCKTREDVFNAIKDSAGNVSAIILGTQALVFDNAAENVTYAKNTPVLAYSIKPVKDGALCGLTADDSKLGAMLAQTIIEVLIKKRPIAAVPVKTDPEPRLVVNMKTAEKIGVVLPISILKVATIIKD